MPASASSGSAMAARQSPAAARDWWSRWCWPNAPWVDRSPRATPCAWRGGLLFQGRSGTCFVVGDLASVAAVCPAVGHHQEDGEDEDGSDDHRHLVPAARVSEDTRQGVWHRAEASRRRVMGGWLPIVGRRAARRRPALMRCRLVWSLLLVPAGSPRGVAGGVSAGCSWGGWSVARCGRHLARRDRGSRSPPSRGPRVCRFASRPRRRASRSVWWRLVVISPRSACSRPSVMRNVRTSLPSGRKGRCRVGLPGPGCARRGRQGARCGAGCRRRSSPDCGVDPAPVRHADDHRGHDHANQPDRGGEHPEGGALDVEALWSTPIVR